jgi:hypothetical protein
MHMIPAFIDESAPPGEIDVFRKLESSGHDWIVIHSLDLAPYNNYRRTEIDFVILIPDVGILCVEVKSHREIGFDGSSWYPDSVTKSPFRQAQDARFALRRRLVDRLSAFAHVPVIHCCVFPRADFAVPANVSIQPFEVMDRGRFAGCGTGEAFCDVLKRMAQLAIGADPQISPLKVLLSAFHRDEFINFCFPIRKRRPEKATEILHREAELEKLLREQQRPVLRLTDNNPRVLVEGGAGTGKSLIGIEVARRKAAQGLRVGYLCFNRLIGNWAARELAADHHPDLIGGSAFSVLMSLTGIEPPNDPDADFWAQLPLLIQDRLTDPACAHDARFDYLVIDEAQDILARPDLLDCVRLLIDGDLIGGSYLMLGDFRNQVLTGADELKANLVKVRHQAARWLLTENCRNYKSIGQVAMTLSMADRSTYSGYMRQGGGLQTWDLTMYEDAKDQVRRISECIDLALDGGFRDEEITVLSFGAEQKSVLPLLREQSLRRFVSAAQFEAKGIRWSTVSAYKGLENKVIIIADVMPSDSGFNRHRFYTGITRAIERLYILCHASGKSQLVEWVAFAGKDNE